MTTTTAALRSLAGVWEGTGHGEFPTIESFDYRERTEFILDEARRLLRYSSDDTIIDADGLDVRPTHTEVGILQLTEDDDFELLSAQPGRVEVLRGAISRTKAPAVELRLESVAIAHDPRVAASTRLYRVDGDRLHYEVWMELVNLEGSRIHTQAQLHRIR